MPDWAVYTSWCASGVVPAAETRATHPDWLAARREALSLACCRGVRYVSVQGPDDVVAAEYDRYTSYWREYPWPFGICGAEHETDCQVCTAELYSRLGVAQLRCTNCKAWHGALSRPEWHAWQVPAGVPDGR